MGRYEGDPRAVFGDDGSATSDGWHVHERDGDWTAYHDERGYLRDTTDASRRAQYATADEVLAHLLGEPVEGAR